MTAETETAATFEVFHTLVPSCGETDSPRAAARGLFPPYFLSKRNTPRLFLLHLMRSLGEICHKKRPMMWYGLTARDHKILR